MVMKNFPWYNFIVKIMGGIIVKIIVAVLFYLLFWFMCYLGTGTDKKNIKGFRSYPDEVQKRVLKNQ